MLTAIVGFVMGCIVLSGDLGPGAHVLNATYCFVTW
jgi:hypothetical protein